MFHSYTMFEEKRRHPRFNVTGRVDAADLCIFPGILLDLSLGGCRVRFPIQVTVNPDEEYQLKLKFSCDCISKSLTLLGRPAYVKTSDSTEIGFQFLRSPDSPGLKDFIEEYTNLNNQDPYGEYSVNLNNAVKFYDGNVCLSF